MATGAILRFQDVMLRSYQTMESCARMSRLHTLNRALKESIDGAGQQRHIANAQLTTAVAQGILTMIGGVQSSKNAGQVIQGFASFAGKGGEFYTTHQQANLSSIEKEYQRSMQVNLRDSDAEVDHAKQQREKLMQKISSFIPLLVPPLR